MVNMENNEEVTERNEEDPRPGFRHWATAAGLAVLLLAIALFAVTFLSSVTSEPGEVMAPDGNTVLDEGNNTNEETV